MRRLALILTLFLPLLCASTELSDRPGPRACRGAGASILRQAQQPQSSATVSTSPATVSAGLPEKQIEQVAQRLAEGQRVSLGYNCTVDGYAPVELSGSLLLQGNCYRAEGNGVEIYCDGGTRWTVDREEKEVYIESSDGIREVVQYKESLKTLVLSDLKYLPGSEDLSPFTFDTVSLDSSWVVTDLR